MDTCAIFIDSGCLRGTTKHYGEINLDYRRLGLHLAEGTPILKTYYYGCEPFCHSTKPTAEELDFKRRKEAYYRYISEGSSVYLRLGKTVRRPGPNGELRFVEKQVDVMLACDLVFLSVKGLISKAIIIAADGDFIPAFEMVKGEGVEIVLAYGSDCSPTKEYLALADKVEELTWPVLKTMELRQNNGKFHKTNWRFG